MHVQQLMISQQSQQVLGINIESYILAPFPNTLAFSGGYHENKFNSVLNNVKKIRIIKKFRDTSYCW